MWKSCQGLTQLLSDFPVRNCHSYLLSLRYRSHSTMEGFEGLSWVPLSGSPCVCSVVHTADNEMRWARKQSSYSLFSILSSLGSGLWAHFSTLLQVSRMSCCDRRKPWTQASETGRSSGFGSAVSPCAVLPGLVYMVMPCTYAYIQKHTATQSASVQIHMFTSNLVGQFKKKELKFFFQARYVGRGQPKYCSRISQWWNTWSMPCWPLK